ncbi:hypothetical protein DSAG12_03085 [Promethearchaeum syntrophicum]|uniref:Uncharacterized protein n=1 Tax=Promethearchaeum syntrophicum TaxID=2594042 RepID=A0A5B9DEP8_9ARCH|nr:hypothetical protein [Candidatus Prometheoarchaeum syntrophicum]QEE17253.1 hypothetical protein DSAG12_03085 [Candidatus Prometheoarchaeum syntrophicum]
MFSKLPSSKKIPSKIPSRSSDGAPMIFFIDIFPSEMLSNPIMPLPMRIDKISNGEPTLTIFPEDVYSKTYNGQVITYNYHKLYSHFFQNLVYFAKKKYRELVHRKLTKDKIQKWWEKSKPLIAQIPDYSRDMTFILKSYLDAYVDFLNSQNSDQALLLYIKTMIDYCQKRIDENTIQLYYKGKIKEDRMYKIKKEHYFPDIVEFDIVNELENKTYRKAVVPIMFYDDLLECFLYNDMQLKKKLGIYEEDEEEEVIDEVNDNKKSLAEQPKEEQNYREMETISFEKIIESNLIIHISPEEFKSMPKNIREIVNEIELSDILIDDEDELDLNSF